MNWFMDGGRYGMGIQMHKRMVVWRLVLLLYKDGLRNVWVGGTKGLSKQRFLFVLVVFSNYPDVIMFSVIRP